VRFLAEDPGDAAALLILPMATAGEIAIGRALAGDARIIAVDGGYDRCLENDLTVDLFVGDGDSVARPPQSIPTQEFQADKSFSDLHGALQSLPQSRQRIVVAGVSGGRIDHQWINVHELAVAAGRVAGIAAIGFDGLLFVTSGGVEIVLPEGTLFSILALVGEPRVTLRGARYELARERLSCPSHGLSNVSCGRVELECAKGVVALIVPDSVPPE